MLIYGLLSFINNSWVTYEGFMLFLIRAFSCLQKLAQYRQKVSKLAIQVSAPIKYSNMVIRYQTVLSLSMSSQDSCRICLFFHFSLRSGQRNIHFGNISRGVRKSPQSEVANARVAGARANCPSSPRVFFSHLFFFWFWRLQAHFSFFHHFFSIFFSIFRTPIYKCRIESF